MTLLLMRFLHCLEYNQSLQPWSSLFQICCLDNTRFVAIGTLLLLQWILVRIESSAVGLELFHYWFLYQLMSLVFEVDLNCSILLFLHFEFPSQGSHWKRIGSSRDQCLELARLGCIPKKRKRMIWMSHFSGFSLYWNVAGVFDSQDFGILLLYCCRCFRWGR